MAKRKEPAAGLAQSLPDIPGAPLGDRVLASAVEEALAAGDEPFCSMEKGQGGIRWSAFVSGEPRPADAGRIRKMVEGRIARRARAFIKNAETSKAAFGPGLAEAGEALMEGAVATLGLGFRLRVPDKGLPEELRAGIVEASFPSGLRQGAEIRISAGPGRLVALSVSDGGTKALTAEGAAEEIRAALSLMGGLIEECAEALSGK